MCKYSDGKWECPHEALPDLEYCIFHLKDENKDVEEFNKGINEILESDKEIINFNGFIFPLETSDFSNKVFNKDVIFKNVVFSGNAIFNSAELQEIADFSEAKFLRNANFIGVKFLRDVDFSGAIFSGNVFFCLVKFPRDANFIWAMFSEITNFNGAEFSEKVIFSGAEFSREASFAEAKFSGKASFVEAMFSGKANFIRAKFSKEANFSETELSRDADFSEAELSRDASFSGAKFLRDVDFSEAEFSKKVNFSGAMFSGKANFSGAEFFGEADFSKAMLYGIFYLIPINSNVMKFIDTFFSDNVRIRANLTQCHFYGSNIEKVDLTDSTWNNDKMKDSRLLSKIWNFVYYSFNSSITIGETPQYLFSWKKIPGKDNGKLIEFLMQKFNIEWVKGAKIEKTDDGKIIRVTNESDFLSLTLNDEKTNVNLKINDYKTDKFIVRKKYGKLNIYASHGILFLNWKELEGIYRRLKQSYQKSGDYDISGEFYIQEMEYKRKQLGFLNRNFRNIVYRIFCLYGERPYNVILVSIIAIISFAILYLFCGVEFTGGKLVDINPLYINYDLSPNLVGLQWLRTNYISVIEDFIKCVYTSVITFTTLGYGDVHPVGWSRLYASIESGIGIFITALFIFVFTRKMIR